MNSINQVDGITALQQLREPPPYPELRDGYLGMVEALRQFLDALTSALLDAEQLARLTADLDSWTQILRERQVGEQERLWGHWVDAPGRGQALVPRLEDEALDLGETSRMSARVSFGRFFVGENGVVHGGAIGLMFDDALGWLSLRADHAPTRTAYLKIDYRSPALVDRPLTVTGEVSRVEGRKRFVHGALHDGDRLCAEAEALLVELRPGQR